MMLYYRWLSVEPPILFYGSPFNYDIYAELPAMRIYRLPCFHSYRTADQVESEYRKSRSRRPQDVFNYLINERDLYLELVARGVPVTFTNQNALLDESIFAIQSEEEKVYDAVYTARMLPLKRHALAQRVSSLMIIGGVFCRDDSQGYFDQLRAEMPQARFTHVEDPRWYMPQRVARLLNQARVGLCLSAREGSMWAATEYLLCGLPVVSTASIGGRSEWFDSGYTRIVPDDPEAIRDAVQELIALQLSPHWIREQTLCRTEEHRGRFIMAVQSIYDREGVARDFASEWPQVFRHKMARWRQHDQIVEHLHDDLP